MKMTDEQKQEKLETSLRHAIEMEKRSSTRVSRATTLLRKWQRTRARIERKIGAATVRQIVNRLSLTKE